MRELHENALELPVSAGQHSDETVPPSPRKRGPKPVKREQAKEAMLRDLREARRTLDDLLRMQGKELACAYKVSRNVARKAREEARLEFVPN
jgi:hypothetical protein